MAIKDKIDSVVDKIKDFQHDKSLERDAQTYGLSDTHFIDDKFMEGVVGYEPITYTKDDGQEYIGDGIRFYRENSTGQMQVVTLPGKTSRENAPKGSGCNRMGISYVLSGHEQEYKDRPNYTAVSGKEDVLNAIVNSHGAETIIADYFNPECASQNDTQALLSVSCKNAYDRDVARNKKAESAGKKTTPLESLKNHYQRILQSLQNVAQRTKKSLSGEHMHEEEMDK